MPQCQLHGWNWGDSKGFHMFEFPPLHPGDTSSPKKPLVTPSSHLFSTFSTDFKTNFGIPWNPPIPLSWSWSCGTNSKTGIWIGGQIHSKIWKRNWNWWNCSNDWSVDPAHWKRDQIESNLSAHGIQGCHKNATYMSFEMSPHLMCLLASTNIPFKTNLNPNLIQMLALKGSWY